MSLILQSLVKNVQKLQLITEKNGFKFDFLSTYKNSRKFFVPRCRGQTSVSRSCFNFLNLKQSFFFIKLCLKKYSKLTKINDVSFEKKMMERKGALKIV